MKLTTFTVIGFYDDNGQTFAIHMEGESGLDAMRRVALAHKDEYPDMQLIAAICGKLHDRGARSESTERDFGALTFAGDSVVGVDAYLDLFEDEAPSPMVLDAKLHLDIMDIDGAVDAANDAAWEHLERQGDAEDAAWEHLEQQGDKE